MHDDNDDTSSLQRLWTIAQNDTGQSRVVARFLLNLFNGYDFNFDLTDFRGLDPLIFEDCITVLRLEHSPHFKGEVHKRLGLTDKQFWKIQETWQFPILKKGD